MLGHHHRQCQFGLVLATKLAGRLVLKRRGSPNAYFFTIHDSILTTEVHSELVVETILETISSITGKPLTVKTKTYEMTHQVSEEVVNDHWEKVKISSKDKYNRKKSSILSNNIKKGMELIRKHSVNPVF